MCASLKVKNALADGHRTQTVFTDSLVVTRTMVIVQGDTIATLQRGGEELLLLEHTVGITMFHLSPPVVTRHNDTSSVCMFPVVDVHEKRANVHDELRFVNLL